jgi:hypothetical protein
MPWMLYPGKKTQNPLVGMLGWLPGPPVCTWIILPTLGFDPWSIQPTVSHYPDNSILAHWITHSEKHFIPELETME